MLAKTNEAELAKYKVKESDREYQFWERNPLSTDLWNRPVFLQKLNYMHYNPTTHIGSFANIRKNIDSSSKFYEKGVDEFCFLTHYLAYAFSLATLPIPTLLLQNSLLTTL